MKKLMISALVAAIALICSAEEQPLRFAFFTDLHYAIGSASVQNLQTCIDDVNNNENVDFVIIGGDCTDFGTDEEIVAVKKALDQLKVKYYVAQGNHDSTWSESGCNTFIKVFGYEQFEFNAGGWRFIGCNCGPSLRMAPALLPKETLLWLDSLEGGQKTIFINHYPQDTSELNYFDVTRQLKKIDTRFEIGGHWHSNTILNYDGIPAVLCRSTLSSGNAPGYTIFELTDSHVKAFEKRVYPNSQVLLGPWYEADIPAVVDKTVYDENGLPENFPFIRYDVNRKYPQVKELWKVAEDCNIAAGFARNGDVAYYTTTTGYLRAISVKDGSKLWERKFGGKIFSTPATDGQRVVFGCSDNYIYCVSASDGKDLWNVKAGKSVVGSPVIKDGIAYIGSSDGIFRAIRMKSGSLKWQFKGVAGFVVCRPYIDDEQLVFGCWGQKLYSLDPATGKLQWSWSNPRPSRNYSPASTVPVKAHGRIFIAIPDRHCYVLDAATGKQLFSVEGGREATCMSADGETVFVKGMQGFAYAFKTGIDLSNVKDGVLDRSKLDWYVNSNSGYEIAPTELANIGGLLIIPTDKGNLLALSEKDGSFQWAHKLSIGTVNPVTAWPEGGKTRMLVSTMDGFITLLEF